MENNGLTMWVCHMKSDDDDDDDDDHNHLIVLMILMMMIITMIMMTPYDMIGLDKYNQSIPGQLDLVVNVTFSHGFNHLMCLIKRKIRMI